MVKMRSATAAVILVLAVFSFLLAAGCRTGSSSVWDIPSDATSVSSLSHAESQPSYPSETGNTTFNECVFNESVAQPSSTSEKHHPTESNSPSATQNSHVPASSTPTAGTTDSSIPTLPEEEPVLSDLEPLGREEYYGRQLLAAMSRSENLLAAYDRIAYGIERGDSRISLDDPRLPLSVADLELVVEYYRRDYPQHFWYTGSYSYRYSGSSVLSIDPDYTLTGSQLEQARENWQAAVEQAVSTLSNARSEYDREKLLHDWLAGRCSYVDGTNAHNAYGALVEGQAVCEGYARAFQYLLYQAGIQSLYVTGSSRNPDTGLAENHGWNIVRIDGKYYHVDLTWNDQSSCLFYAYFNLTDRQIQEDHQLDEYNSPLPSCSSDAANYFVRNGLVISDPTVDRVASLLRQGNGTARIYTTGSTEELWNWFQQNIQAIAQQVGITGRYSYSCYTLGHEILLSIE